MKLLRFSLKEMLLITALIAIACTALLMATVTWACIAVTCTVVLLLIAVVGAFYRKAEYRAFYCGAALFGWTYWLFASVSNLGSQYFVTVPILEMLHGQLARDVILPAAQQPIVPIVAGSFNMDAIPDGAEVRSLGSRGLGYAFPIAHYFYIVGHAIFALLFAIAGGIVALYFYNTSAREADRASRTSSSGAERP